jgi:hypothetical protein
MTKPAAVFLQLLGVVLIIVGFGSAGQGAEQGESMTGGYLFIAAGLGLLVWGGIAIRQRISKDSEPSTPKNNESGNTHGTSPESTVETRLQRLAQLKDQGLITDEEFTERRANILKDI